MVDLNFDKRPDVLYSTADGQFYAWINQGDRWSDRIGLGRPDLSRRLWTGDPRVKLADMNGDRLLDLVWMNLQLGQIEYYPLKGYNRLGGSPQSIFDSKVVMRSAPVITTYNPDNLRLIDINGDGLADLVYVGSTEVRYWLNLGNNEFERLPRVVRNTPTLGGGFRFADMTGSGTTGVLWYDAVAQRHVYLDFINGLKPNLLSQVANGLGREINFEYKNSTDYYREALQAGRPWCTKPPFAHEGLE